MSEVAAARGRGAGSSPFGSAAGARNRNATVLQHPAATVHAVVLGQESAGIEGRSVAESNRRFALAAARGDARAMAAVYAEDAELLPPNREALRGRQAIEIFWQRDIEAGLHARFKTSRIEQADGLAYEVGRYTLWFEAENAAVTPEVGKYVVIHRHQADGSWRRVVEIFNSDAPSI